MHLEINDDWGITYTNVKWMPYCRKHEEPRREITGYRECLCRIPEEVWKKVFFMDQLEKFK